MTLTRNHYIIMAIALQIIVLSSFVVRYEILKSTGTTVYMPLRGYDPTDIFRGDYVNLSYELPYSGSIEKRNNYNSKLYAILNIDNQSIGSISQITKIKPESGTFFMIKNGSTNQKETYTILTTSGKTLSYESTQCLGIGYSVGDDIQYVSWGSEDSISTLVKKSEDQKSYYGEYKDGTIKAKSDCTGNYRFQTTATDRWFVPEGTGLDLEQKIREGDIYAKWKVGGNGAVIITDVLSKRELPQ